jgi:hypothetical protein
MVLRGFPPGREVGWQTTLRTELTILRFMLEVAELSWLEQAADAAQAGGPRQHQRQEDQQERVGLERQGGPRSWTARSLPPNH